jgi:anti-anti-sigma regulatory factor
MPISIQRDARPEAVHYALAGQFGPAEAWALVKRLRAEADAQQITLDLRHVQRNSELGVYLLAHDLPLHERRGRVLRLCGLTEGEQRLLRYLCAEHLAA